MSRHTALVHWQRSAGEAFTDQRYSRRHVWRFDGGAEVAASSSPHSVPLPCSDATAVDPEEAFVASLSSCHMLWFLSIAARHGFVVDRYDDPAEGTLARDAAGRLSMTLVTLRPAVVFSGLSQPDAERIEQMHHQAHDECFIARSVKSEVRCLPQLPQP